MGVQWAFLLGVVLAAVTSPVWCRVDYEVLCSDTELEVLVPRGKGVESVKLDKWGILPECATRKTEDFFHIKLTLNDDLPCGTTKVKNKITGSTVYYHRVAMTTAQKRHLVLVKCYVDPNKEKRANIVKRNVLPPEFEEPDYIEITSEVSGQAPIPVLNVGVRQSNALIDGQINVVPGTPLTMEVFLDQESAGTYGILVSYMEVTDTGRRNETIIYNGCSVDPYLFENFVTNNGDLVSAKFRAFKFPESNFVLFRGTVDVCLDKCQGIFCSNGQVGFGRKRRDVSSKPADPNKIFEVTMMTFIKVETIENYGESVPSTVNRGVAIAEGSRDYDYHEVSPDRALPAARSTHSDPPPFVYFSGGLSSFSSVSNFLSLLLSALLLTAYL